MGFQTEGAKKSACKHCITRREIRFQKKAAEILVVDKYIQQQQEDGFTIVSLDESFFFYDCLIRVWIDEKKTPIVRVTLNTPDL